MEVDRTPLALFIVIVRALIFIESEVSRCAGVDANFKACCRLRAYILFGRAYWQNASGSHEEWYSLKRRIDLPS